MSNYVKPIETLYNGYRFRSRLEARWAVFFDEAGIKYQYETQGFTDGEEKYLPDFYLPDFDTYAEVKGDEERYHDDIRRMCKIISGRGSDVRRLLVLGDIPYDEESNGIYWFPVLYYHPLHDSVVREYRTIIWREEDETALFVFEWGLVPDCQDNYKYKRQCLWEGSFDKQQLNPIPDAVMEPHGLKRSDEEDSRETFRDEFASPKLVAAYSAARMKRF